PLKNIDTNPERFDIVTSSKNPNQETKTGLNNLHLKGTQTRPKDQATGFKHIKRCVIGIDFKHAVEFSSFGCIPRLTLSGSAWGNSVYFSDPFRECQLGDFSITTTRFPCRPFVVFAALWQLGEHYPSLSGMQNRGDETGLTRRFVTRGR
ncbi:hypothetical protein, partial [Luteococcus sanguinis]